MADSESQSRTVLAMMERQLQHMARLLDDLLDVSRISRDKYLHHERIDLRHVVDAALEANRPLIEEMGHAFSVSAPSEPAFLNANPVRFAQILSNLLDERGKVHAARRTNPAEGRASRGRGRGLGHRQRHRYSWREPGIDFRDVRPGFGSQSSNAQGGLGIGLSLAKGLVALHGGTIQAYSEGLGRGSEFRVRVPTRLTLDADSATPVSTVLTPQRLKILVVDDNRDAAESLSMLLELKGHEVRMAYDGENALQLAEDFRPHMA